MRATEIPSSWSLLSSWSILWPFYFLASLVSPDWWCLYFAYPYFCHSGFLCFPFPVSSDVGFFTSSLLGYSPCKILVILQTIHFPTFIFLLPTPSLLSVILVIVLLRVTCRNSLSVVVYIDFPSFEDWLGLEYLVFIVLTELVSSFVIFDSLAVLKGCTHYSEALLCILEVLDLDLYISLECS